MHWSRRRSALASGPWNEVRLLAVDGITSSMMVSRARYLVAQGWVRVDAWVKLVIQTVLSWHLRPLGACGMCRECLASTRARSVPCMMMCCRAGGSSLCFYGRRPIRARLDASDRRDRAPFRSVRMKRGLLRCTPCRASWLICRRTLRGHTPDNRWSSGHVYVYFPCLVEGTLVYCSGPALRVPDVVDSIEQRCGEFGVC